MNTTHLLISTLALSASILGAQQPNSPLPFGSAANTTVTNPDGQRSTVTIVKFAVCPVSLQAKHGSGGALVAVYGHDGGTRQEIKPTAHIHLLLGKIAGDQQVASVTVTARGLSARGRINRTSMSDNPDLRRTLSADVSMESDGSLYADLALPGFASVHSIKLVSINYANGTAWDLSRHMSCTVTPDLLMLTANR